MSAGLLDYFAPHSVGQAAIRQLDRLLRWLMGIEEFSRERDCILRISLVTAAEDVELSDGTRINRGEAIGELHWWNEHILQLPDEGATLQWAVSESRKLRRSLAELAAVVETDPRFREIRVFHAETPVFGAEGMQAVTALAERLGFETRRCQKPGRLLARIRRLGESLLFWALLWTYNPRSQRGRGLRRERCRLFITRTTLLNRYAAPKTCG